MPANNRMSAADRLVQTLSAAALEPGLGSVLLWDAPEWLLTGIADLFARILSQVHDQNVAWFPLMSGETEDRMWGCWQPRSDSNGVRLSWKSGLLAGPDQGKVPRLLVLPDLSTLEPLTARACVEAMSGVPPACPSASVGMVSPHLLDRWAIRLAWRIDGKDLRQCRLSQCLTQSETWEIPLPTRWNTILDQARKCSATLDSTIMDRLMEWTGTEAISGESVQGYRRTIALARLSIALARMQGCNTVQKENLEEALKLLGLERKNTPRPRQNSALPPPEANPSEKNTNKPEKKDPSGENPNFSEVNPGKGNEQDPVFSGEPHPPETLEGLEFCEEEKPYPEDHADSLRENSPLRPLSGTQWAEGQHHGRPIGSKPVQDPSEMAIIPTVLEAAKWQAVPHRSSHARVNNGLSILFSDLRAHRYLAKPDHQFVLLLDFTSVTGRDWEKALFPDLHWAYVRRARIGVVRVGAADAAHPWCAQRLEARNLLDPRILRGLQAEGGQATPLADGFRQVRLLLRKAMGHGRGAATLARLVIITDGRGNVPLEDSLLNRAPPGNVGAKGIEDAIIQARSLAMIRNLQVVLLDPQPRYLSHLPGQYAAILKAWVRTIGPRVEQESIS
ncbi:MAG: Mg-chelatase subunit ChlI-like protein [Magnetococcales bacterium]|nr:Mg-chelatase subunit ChlI-like protein [Magnetococcales bacterium]